MKNQILILDFRSVMLTVCVFFIAMPDAQAYIDPGSSSYFFQILIAGLTAIVYFFSSIKAKVLQLFGKKAIPPTPEKNPVSEKTSPPASDNTSVVR